MLCLMFTLVLWGSAFEVEVNPVHHFEVRMWHCTCEVSMHGW